MSLDNAQSLPLLRVTAAQATKLVLHDGTYQIALIIETAEGESHYLLDQKGADLFADYISEAIASDGLTPLV